MPGEWSPEEERIDNEAARIASGWQSPAIFRGDGARTTAATEQDVHEAFALLAVGNKDASPSTGLTGHKVLENASSQGSAAQEVREAFFAGPIQPVFRQPQRQIGSSRPRSLVAQSPNVREPSSTQGRNVLKRQGILREEKFRSKIGKYLFGTRKRQMTTMAIGLIATTMGLKVTTGYTPPALAGMFFNNYINPVDPNTQALLTAPPDCRQYPALITSINSTADMRLKMTLYASPSDKTAAENGKPFQTVTGFDIKDSNGNAVQARLLPPIGNNGVVDTNSSEKVLRLPRATIAGTMAIGVCFTQDFGKAVTIDPKTGQYYVSKSALSLIAYPQSGTPFIRAYENATFVLKKGQEANSPFPKGELEREARVLSPDAKNPSIQNESVLIPFEYATLGEFSLNGSCGDNLIPAVTNYLAKYISSKVKHPVQVSFRSDDTGTIQMPADTYANAKGQPALQNPNVQFSTPDTVCSTYKVVG